MLALFYNLSQHSRTCWLPRQCWQVLFQVLLVKVRCVLALLVTLVLLPIQHVRIMSYHLLKSRFYHLLGPAINWTRYFTGSRVWIPKDRPRSATRSVHNKVYEEIKVNRKESRLGALKLQEETFKGSSKIL